MKEMGKMRHEKMINRSTEGGFGGVGRVGSIDSLISQNM